MICHIDITCLKVSYIRKVYFNNSFGMGQVISVQVFRLDTQMIWHRYIVLLHLQIDIKFDHQVFIDDKPKYYDFANKTENMTGEEVFASFSEPE